MIEKTMMEWFGTYWGRVFNWKTIAFYVAYILVFSVVIRGVIAAFKSLSRIQEEAIKRRSWEKIDVRRSFLEIWKRCFKGWGDSKKTDDFLISSILGAFELIAYPFLIYSGNVQYIGGWIAIKTSGHWGEWGKDRTSFNRFLLGNVLVIVCSCIILLINMPALSKTKLCSDEKNKKIQLTDKSGSFSPSQTRHPEAESVVSEVEPRAK